MFFLGHPLIWQSIKPASNEKTWLIHEINICVSYEGVNASLLICIKYFSDYILLFCNFVYLGKDSYLNQCEIVQTLINAKKSL